jgi:hypothetical protein
MAVIMIYFSGAEEQWQWVCRILVFSACTFVLPSLVFAYKLGIMALYAVCYFFIKAPLVYCFCSGGSAQLKRNQNDAFRSAANLEVGDLEEGSIRKYE